MWARCGENGYECDICRVQRKIREAQRNPPSPPLLSPEVVQKMREWADQQWPNPYDY